MNILDKFKEKHLLNKINQIEKTQTRDDLKSNNIQMKQYFNKVQWQDNVNLQQYNTWLLNVFFHDIQDMFWSCNTTISKYSIIDKNKKKALYIELQIIDNSEKEVVSNKLREYRFVKEEMSPIFVKTNEDNSIYSFEVLINEERLKDEPSNTEEFSSRETITREAPRQSDQRL